MPDRETISMQAGLLATRRAMAYQAQARKLDAAYSNAWDAGEHMAAQCLAEQSEMCRKRANYLFNEGGYLCGESKSLMMAAMRV